MEVAAVAAVTIMKMKIMSELISITGESPAHQQRSDLTTELADNTRTATSRLGIDYYDVQSNHHNRLSKYIAGNKVKVSDVAATAYTDKLCNCPNSEPGKVKIDIDEHLPGCRFRKRSSRYAMKTSVIPSKIVDGCSLGIALGEECY